MKSPLVSVIIPAYNSARYISKAIESVIDQTYNHAEIIVIDDGSIDETPKELSFFGDTIRSLSQKNQGPASARNSGYSISNGEYIMFLDADDWIEPKKLEKQVNFLEKHPSFGWVYCDVQYVDREERKLFLASERFAYSKRKNIEGYIFDELINGNFIPIHSPLIRREIVNSEKPFDEDERLIGVEDWDFLLNLSLKSRVAFMPEVLAFCVIRSDSLSANPSARDKRRFDLLYKAIQKYPGEINQMGLRGRKFVADIYNWFGYKSYHEKRPAEAIKRLSASIISWPFQGRAWFYLIFSFLQKCRIK